MTAATGPTSLQFFAALRWLDGSPLLDGIEPYRREIFTRALDTYRPDGSPVFNLVVSGRAKKNAKTLDLVLAALFVLTIRRSHQGSDCYVLANDQDQAADDLSLAKKLIACNPDLAAEIAPLANELRLRDGSGSLRILPARDVAGSHGKTYAFVGFDEIHAYKDWSLIEALAPDPTRTDALTWITSYASIYARAGAPLFDLMNIGKAGRDPRMLFSWYSGDYSTDPTFTDLPAERRANPSMGSWADGAGYLEQQRMRLPFGRFRRLHLNLPGAPDGAAFDQGKVLAAVVSGRRSIPPKDGVRYAAFVDMSGGSNDDAVLAIGHLDGRVAIVDLVAKQIGSPPFDPRQAVARFAGLLAQYGIHRVAGDAYAGQTFRADFQREGVAYEVRGRSASDLYEALEPKLNAGEVELLDDPVLVEQAICLVWRGGKITHEPNGHDDHVNAVAGLVNTLCGFRAVMVAPIVVTAAWGDPGALIGDGMFNPVNGIPPDGGAGQFPYERGW
jgi:hypothetical protein